MRKVTLRMDEELVGEAREAAGIRGLSGFVGRALRGQLQHDRLTTLLDEIEAEVGPIPTCVMEEVRYEWTAHDDTGDDTVPDSGLGRGRCPPLGE